MKVDIYYADYPLEGMYDYSKRTVYSESEEAFWTEINNKDTKFIKCSNENKKSYSSGEQYYLNKDRIIEICIYNNEEEE